MVKGYHHLNQVERDKLALGLAAGFSFREIADEIHRDHRTLEREYLRHTRYGKPYLPSLAQGRSEQWAKDQRFKAPLKSPEIILYVRDHLRWGWSPEQIAGRLSVDYPKLSLCPETVYRYIYDRRILRERFWRYLSLGRKRRRRRHARRVYRMSRITGAVSIDLRPKRVLQRREPGHWETDNMEGKRSDRVGLSVSTERSTRLTVLSRLSSRKSETKAKALTKRLGHLPAPLRLTITADNGSENSQHLTIAQDLKINFYFCHPYHAWEKGTVENTIGRIRRYLPKGESLMEVTEEDIWAIEERLNSTPRKCLGYLTPYEAMANIVGKQKEIDSAS